MQYTTTLNGECTDGFTGTSASAPLVSGVITLALQAKCVTLLLLCMHACMEILIENTAMADNWFDIENTHACYIYHALVFKCMIL